MIASLEGRVASVALDRAVVEVGGVGLLVQCTPATLARLRVGEDARLATSLVVREDSLTLYGFEDDDERSVFEQLQTASGVGPRLALAVLTVLPPDTVRVAVATDDLATLTRVPGIGRKGAQRILLELKDRLGALPAAEAAAAGLPPTPVAPWREQLQEALTGLGWSAREAEDALAKVAPAEEYVDSGDPPDVPALLRQALAVLGRAR
ncbi:MAG: Holliday junction branch migration protein RuvA [Actinomycetota bacterium]|nr:Holliday junction branch migration protein RuvA [Actinomycetota bacterium]